LLRAGIGSEEEMAQDSTPSTEDIEAAIKWGRD